MIRPAKNVFARNGCANNSGVEHGRVERDRAKSRRRSAPAAVLAGLLATLSASTPPAVAQTPEDRLLSAGGHPGSRDRVYAVYAPPGISEAPALVMVLHGCKQTHRDIMAASRFLELAEANAADGDPTNDFVALFPFVTSYPSVWAEPRATNCWGWWMDRHREEGTGEAADLDRLMTEAQSAFGTDPQRRFVAGLSSGAAMAVALGVSYAERIAGVGSVAGVPFGERAEAVAIAWPFHQALGFWSARDANCLDAKIYRSRDALVADMSAALNTPDERAPTPLMIIHSENDCTVEARNAEALFEVWAQVHGAALAEPLREERLDCAKDGVACARRRLSNAERTIVEAAIYEGRRDRDTHYWVGDNEGAPFSESDGPSATCLLLDFFKLSPEAALCE